MSYIPSSTTSSPSRSHLDNHPSPSSNQPMPSRQPSHTPLLAGMCPQPASLSPRFSPRLLRRKISHNISSLVNKFESSNPTIQITANKIRAPSCQSMLSQVPRASLDRFDGISVVRRRGTSNLRSSSSADVLGRVTAAADRYSSSSDQIVLETTTFMRGWIANKNVEARGGMRTNTTHTMSSETLRGSERRPPPSMLNRGSRSSVSPSDCVGSRRERLSSAVQEKVRLFDTAVSTRQKIITQPSMASLTKVNASPCSLANYTQPSSAFSESNSEVTLTPTKSAKVVTPSRTSSFRSPERLSVEHTPQSWEPLFVNSATPYSITPSSPTTYYRSAERKKITHMSPEQATRAMELLTPKGSPVRYKLIPTVQQSTSNAPESRSLRGSWRRMVGDPFNTNSGSNRGSISSYRGNPVQPQDGDLAALPQRKLFARIGLRSDIFKQPSEERQRLQMPKKKSSKVASLKRFFDKASSLKPIAVPTDTQGSLGTPLHRANTIKKTDRSLVSTKEISAVTLSASRLSTTKESTTHAEPPPTFAPNPTAPIDPVLQSIQPDFIHNHHDHHHRSPRAKGKAINAKLKLFESQDHHTSHIKPSSHEDRKPLAPSTNKSSSRRRKRFSRGSTTLHRQADGENEGEGMDRTIRSDEVETIVADFQNTEARLRSGKRKVLFEKWRAIEKSMYHGSGTRGKGDGIIRSGEVRLGSMRGGTAVEKGPQRDNSGGGGGMVIKEAQCGLKHPKPLRVVEMKRMVLLCSTSSSGSDKVGGAERDKVTQLRKLWHGYLRHSPTFE